MKKAAVIMMLITVILPAAGCPAAEAPGAEIIGGADGRTSINLTQESGEDADKEASDDLITGDQAFFAIKNYCRSNDPDLEDIEKEGEYPVYWVIESEETNEIVILFRSYTGAFIRYHIDPVSGDTYITEYVPGITPEEQRTDEQFNIREYMAEPDMMAETASPVPGTWQTISIAYGDGETMQPEYYVQFTESHIIYGHMNNGIFITDHTDEIRSFNETAEGKYRMQAVSSSGVQYTYQTSESDDDVLEYYETWSESDFADTYSGGASLTRCSEGAGS